MSNPFDRIQLVQGDLTRETTDAIVNAANESLRGGGGVDGAIHRAAGPELLAECIERHRDGCPTGDVRLTGGHDLPARWVIHAVGPIWRGGEEGEPALLSSCFTRALDVAAERDLRTVAFPAISCGVYGYPHKAAAEVSLAAIARGLERHAGIECVRIVLFGPDLLGVFQAALARLRAARS